MKTSFRPPFEVFGFLMGAILVTVFLKDWQVGLLVTGMCIISCAVFLWIMVYTADQELVKQETSSKTRMKVYIEQTTNSRVLIDSDDVLHLLRSLKFVNRDVYFEAWSPAVGSITPVIVKYWALNCTTQKFPDKKLTVIDVGGRLNHDGDRIYLIPKQARDDGYEYFQEHAPDLDPIDYEEEEEE